MTLRIYSQQKALMKLVCLDLHENVGKLETKTLELKLFLFSCTTHEPEKCTQWRVHSTTLHSAPQCACNNNYRTCQNWWHHGNHQGTVVHCHCWCGCLDHSTGHCHLPVLQALQEETKERYIQPERLVVASVRLESSIKIFKEVETFC